MNSNGQRGRKSTSAVGRSVVDIGERSSDNHQIPAATYSKYEKSPTEMISDDSENSESIDRTETSITSAANRTGSEPVDYVETGMSRRSLTLIYHKAPSKGVQDSYAGEDYTFGWFDKVTGVVSIILFFLDVGTDINLIVTYFRLNEWFWGLGTTVIVAVPSLVVCGLGLNWYIIDYQKEKKSRPCMWFWRFFFTLIQCGPVIRTIEYLYCGWKSLNKNLKPEEHYMYYRYMLRQSVDICLLHLFESFFEAAPQLTLQIYIMIVLKPSQDFLHSSIVALSLLTSWSSLAISLTSYNKSLRTNDAGKAKMSLISVVFYFIWRASEVGGRILCLALFASTFRYMIFLVLAVHWLAMFMWLVQQKTSFYKNRCLEIFFNLLCGYVMIFCFLNMREGHTRFRFLAFYCVIYIENFIMLAFWFRFTQDLGVWFHLWGFAGVIILFVLHLVFQLLYYMFFHPTKKIEVCLPCDRYLIYSSMCSEVSQSVDSKRKILHNFREHVEDATSCETVATKI